MMRLKPSSSMQKTYDECYLMCSTAVYFEGQNNESEALRSWRSALETIYYHNAYRVPPNYVPKTETEKALQDSLRQLELQCKERVNLLEALQESRKEAAANDESTEEKDPAKSTGLRPPKLEKGKKPLMSTGNASSKTSAPLGWIGNGTIPAVDYMDISKPPPLPVRPSAAAAAVSSTPTTSHELKDTAPSSSLPHKLSPSPIPPAAPLPSIPLTKASSRGSSPERRKIMLTTLRQKKDLKKPKYKSSSSSPSGTGPAASKAAGLAWGTIKKKPVPLAAESSDSDLRKDTESRQRLSSEDISRKIGQQKAASSPFSSDYIPSSNWREPAYADQAPSPGLSSSQIDSAAAAASKSLTADALSKPPPAAPKPSIKSLPPTKYPSYRKEYPSHSAPLPSERNIRTPPLNRSTSATQTPTVSSSTGEASEQPSRRKLPKSQSTPRALNSGGANRASVSSTSGDEPARPPPRKSDASLDGAAASVSRKPKPPAPRRKPRITPPSSDQDSPGEERSSERGDEDPKLRDIMKNLPRGIDVNAARQILNDVVVRGDEVHWDDVAGLETAKKALKEAVVYPFLRPDLFMGLREPARGMLLFGPPGTGKTMLARAVATESKSTFFSVSASTLTSKWHGESEKLVRALFGLAKALAPSIIFVDEIDSLLSTRSSGTEHEASRRSKTEFLIQWSDLQRAAAGRNQSTDKGNDGGGDPSRVLVLAATNLPWDIDEAARRRFVRRQYIPLPEDHVREQQIRRLLSHQTHEMSNEDIEVLVKVTEGFSGSDITALAKDAAMGPLRNLGEALLHTPMDQIRPIRFEDFEASLYTIRPSVGKDGLKKYEDWAKEYGERGG
ncbi:hypothetical protein TMatcc_006954 [Talaromyces marneffei ATCC 18224]|uniref:AAA family ATPase, putative n=1 Tax=Talaromyces marneffei (strain ATCC 18224 / CBS 334.59 / QM 7333) TaxID=441960 RepID=B6QE10_TALMQ|nr:uncharacterized protein EYB26_003953 [Talaromyces marneffei]EEA23881.1 AAA family ATPase, putative [Talaromyces marneffei ATCC 18224]QGA16286.1 hypothetical protein EYB26_003953 [Talaromyces marneffei]